LTLRFRFRNLERRRLCAKPLSNSLPACRERPLVPPDITDSPWARGSGWHQGSRSERESEIRVYAIVRSGGRQHKVAVGDIVEVDKISTSSVGDTVELSTLLVVDGDAVTSDPWVLAGIKVQAEVVDHHKGAKIDILRYKNKTGYRRRQGHRQQYTALKITGIPTAAK
jgi:large subunit ribosomal protein L21